MESKMKELQTVLLKMLKDIDAVCRKNGISYQLFAGSALGAVRDGGFIPWDDDLDIAMSRDDYDRFLTAAEEGLCPDRYYIQKEFSEHYPMFSSKVRLHHTTFMERYIPRDKAMHQGVYVDIFPLDNLSDHPVTAKLQFIASKLVIAKCLYQRGYATDSFPKKLMMIGCSVLPIRGLRRFVERRGDTGSSRIHSFFGGTSVLERGIYPRSSLSTIEVSFEDGVFPVSREYDRVLSIQYGDYMTPTDVGDRDKKRHFLMMDLHHGYERYLEWQDRQVITSFTESIR